MKKIMMILLMLVTLTACETNSEQEFVPEGVRIEIPDTLVTKIEENKVFDYRSNGEYYSFVFTNEDLTEFKLEVYDSEFELLFEKESNETMYVEVFTPHAIGIYQGYDDFYHHRHFVDYEGEILFQYDRLYQSINDEGTTIYSYSYIENGDSTFLVSTVSENGFEVIYTSDYEGQVSFVENDILQYVGLNDNGEIKIFTLNIDGTILYEKEIDTDSEVISPNEEVGYVLGNKNDDTIEYYNTSGELVFTKDIPFSFQLSLAKDDYIQVINYVTNQEMRFDYEGNVIESVNYAITTTYTETLSNNNQVTLEIDRTDETVYVLNFLDELGEVISNRIYQDSVSVSVFDDLVFVNRGEDQSTLVLNNIGEEVEELSFDETIIATVTEDRYILEGEGNVVLYDSVTDSVIQSYNINPSNTYNLNEHTVLQSDRFVSGIMILNQNGDIVLERDNTSVDGIESRYFYLLETEDYIYFELWTHIDYILGYKTLYIFDKESETVNEYTALPNVYDYYYPTSLIFYSNLDYTYYINNNDLVFISEEN